MKHKERPPTLTASERIVCCTQHTEVKSSGYDTVINTATRRVRYEAQIPCTFFVKLWIYVEHAVQQAVQHVHNK